MAQPASTAETYDSFPGGSIREDLGNKVFDISPVSTPLMTMIRRGKAKGTFHEFQTSTLGTPVDTNANVEGDNMNAEAAIGTVRRGNYTQIADKALTVSGTQQVVDHAGIKNYKGWQMLKKMQQLKNDVDKQMCSNKASVATTADTGVRISAGAEAFIYTNAPDATDDLRGVGGTKADYGGGVWPAPVDGTQRAIQEDYLKTALSKCWDAGGEVTKVLVGSFNKMAISGFTGGTTRTDRSEDKRLYASIDYYVGDFQEVQVIPSRHVRPRTALVIDPTLWQMCILRGFRTRKMGVTGDNDSWQLLIEYCLQCDQEAGNAVIADLTT